MPQLDETNFNNKTDQELVNLVLENNKYYSYLIERYEAKLMRYITRIFRMSKEDAEDILQEVFIKVYQNLNDYDQEMKFSSWIYRIAHNETINHLRKINSRPKTVYLDPHIDISPEIKQDLEIEENIDQNYFSQNLMKTINKLDTKYRDVLILKYIEDKDYREISDILKKPMGTIATLLSRARKQFKKIYVPDN
jgi:RNA polymerase sigma-70 factor (ECF subfamily)